MKGYAILGVALVLVMAIAAVSIARANENDPVTLQNVYNATNAYRSLDAAKKSGYRLVKGLDQCFNDPGVGGMGFHYINSDLLDTNIEPLKPEAMVYAPQANGKLALGAVEYIVPIPAWDKAHSKPPQLFGQSFLKDTTLGVYSLHAWLFFGNPFGVFSEWNPRVSCS